jgi:hypothetical protein
MNLCAGDHLEAHIEGKRIVLIPRKRQRKRPFRGRITKDPITGLPVLTAGENAPVLTQKEVEDILHG